MASFSCYDSGKNDWQKTVDIAKQVISSIEKQVEIYQKKADETTGNIMPIKQVGRLFGQRHSSISDYRDDRYGYGYSDSSPQKCAANAKLWAEKTYLEAKKLHEENILSIANNIAVTERVTLFMENVGIPSTYSTKDLKSRKRYPENITCAAGYREDLGRCCIINDGWSSVETDYKRMLEDIDKFLAFHTKEEEQKKLDIAAKEKIKEKDLQRAALVVKYELDYLAGWDNILNTIIDKNKYLKLAHYLMKNREDWNDGYDYAQCGLNSFTAESAQDKAIEINIIDQISNWGGDGRIFRDCEWNYDRIFSLVDNEDLMKDYQIAASFNHD